MWWNYRRTISAWNLSDHHHHHWCSADNRHNGGVKIQDICNNILQILGFTRLKRLQLNRSIFCWHSCPQLLSSPVFIRWSNIKWYFCCLSWGIFKKLATDPLQMQHRGNETNIKMLVYFQEFNLKKLRRLKNNVDMLNRNRYICIFSCFNGTKITKWVQHGADKVFFIIIDSQYNLILFTNILVLWILMKFSPAPRTAAPHLSSRG